MVGPTDKMGRARPKAETGRSRTIVELSQPRPTTKLGRIRCTTETGLSGLRSIHGLPRPIDGSARVNDQDGFSDSKYELAQTEVRDNSARGHS